MTEIAIAYDVRDWDQALALDQAIGDGPELAKVGLELFAAEGPRAVRALVDRGRRVFLDLKLHDIPNTVRGGARAAAGLGVELVTVHGLGGEAMIRAAVEGAAEAGTGTQVVVVTLLTSLKADRLPPGFARPFDLPEVAAEMLSITLEAGAKGIVCSAADLPAIRARRRAPFYAVTPGIRPSDVARDDQERVATVGEAARLGSSLIVLGRAVTAAADPAAALADARRQRDQALAALHR